MNDTVQQAERPLWLTIKIAQCALTWAKFSVVYNPRTCMLSGIPEIALSYTRPSLKGTMCTRSAEHIECSHICLPLAWLWRGSPPAPCLQLLCAGQGRLIINQSSLSPSPSAWTSSSQDDPTFVFSLSRLLCSRFFAESQREQVDCGSTFEEENQTSLLQADLKTCFL